MSALEIYISTEINSNNLNAILDFVTTGLIHLPPGPPPDEICFDEEFKSDLFSMGIELPMLSLSLSVSQKKESFWLLKMAPYRMIISGFRWTAERSQERRDIFSRISCMLLCLIRSSEFSMTPTCTKTFLFFLSVIVSIIWHFSWWAINLEREVWMAIFSA